VRVALAQELTRLPATRSALSAGRIDLTKARAIAEVAAALGGAGARELERRVLARADDKTSAQLRASARRAAMAIDPEAAQRRRQTAVAERGTEFFPLPDGMASWSYTDAVENVAAFHRFVTAKARAAAGPGDTRTLNQLRADVLADIGRDGLSFEHLPTEQGRHPQIHVVVSAATLLGLDDQPAELAGIGPITAEVARRIAADGTWRRLLTDPRTGRFDELSTDSYEPPQDLRDHVVARDRTCRGLGCQLPAERCDLDHRVPHPRGPTTAHNLDAACRPYHEVKTFTDTKVVDDGAGGLYITPPSGRTYHRPADPVLEDFTDATQASDGDASGNSDGSTDGTGAEDDTPPF
jgi:hypothetical protein